MGYPNKEQAKALIDKATKYRRNFPPKKKLTIYTEEEFIAHSYNVALCAEKIAKKTAYLNPEKAFVLGLLHDYGKRIDEKVEDIFHGQDGFNEMMKLGHYNVAKVCLTHTFPIKNFDEKDFFYPDSWIDWIRKNLENIEYDDYDRLIQLCDKFAEAKNVVSIEERAKHITKRYGLSLETKNNLLNEGLVLKKYFDKVCQEDIYKIIGI